MVAYIGANLYNTRPGKKVVQMDEFGKTIASAFIGALIGEIVKRSVDAIAERIKKASRGTGKHIKKL